MDDPAGLVDREHRLQRLALEGQLAVGVVLEDPEVVLGGELDQAPPLLGRERAAGRVVGVGDDVGELDRPLGERRLQRADVEPVGLERHRHQLDAELLQQQQGAVIGRLLDDHPVARLEQVLEQHRPRLERAVGDHHLRGSRSPMPLGDPLAEPGMADPDPVGERRLPVARQAPAPPPPAPARGGGCRRWARRARMKSCRRPSTSTLATPALRRLLRLTAIARMGFVPALRCCRDLAVIAVRHRALAAGYAGRGRLHAAKGDQSRLVLRLPDLPLRLRQRLPGEGEDRRHLLRSRHPLVRRPDPVASRVA